MKAVIRLSTLAPVVALACAPVHSFSPASNQRFEPRTENVEVLEEEPTREYTLVGYVECRGESVGDAMPYLKKLARENGGDAILKIESTPVFVGLSTYRAAVIRFTDANPETPAG